MIYLQTIEGEKIKVYDMGCINETFKIVRWFTVFHVLGKRAAGQSARAVGVGTRKRIAVH